MCSRNHILLIVTTMVHFIQADTSHPSTYDSLTLSRHKRKLPLLFHDFGVSQFVCGFGVPVDLELETVTSGIVFKSQLPLPATPADLKNHTTHNINGRATDGSGYPKLNSRIRWDFYKALESWATNAGLNGRTCVLKTLCEAAQVPFNNESGDLWHDIAHIIFTPFSSADAMHHHGNKEYLAATKIGLSTVNSCDSIFKDCPKSLLSIFTQLF